MNTYADISARLHREINRQRLVDTALRLLAVYSPTGNAGAAADCLANILREDGFSVERPAAGHPAAPAVVVRWETGRPGRTLQFNGHLDTVHLPFVPPQIHDGQLTGSGASDMKAGLVAAVEALRALREAEVHPGGGILLTAHDLHEAPWGFGQQLDQMITEGIAGDAVLIPEPLCDRLPVVGRGAATWKVTFRREGSPVHEVMRPADVPDVIGAGAKLIDRLGDLRVQLAAKSDPLAGAESVFVGQIHGGEIYNQCPTECWVEGTRRWLPGTKREDVERGFRDLLQQVASDTRTQVDAEFRFIRDSFYLDQEDPVVAAFQKSYVSLAGRPLPTGPKPFVDDGNSFWGIRQIPAITHGPDAGGQHTVNEWVSIDSLMRVAHLYALTAVTYCGAAP